MEAIIRAAREPVFPAKVGIVISPTKEAQALERASELGVPTSVVAFGEDYPTRLETTLSSADTTLVCLAGYMRLLPSEVLAQYPRRVLNIHPALLPKFGGKGMYGNHVHRAVIDAEEPESGCTVHFVTEAYDEGDIVLQKRVPVLRGDSPETLATRVLQAEHETYPEAIRMVLNG